MLYQASQWATPQPFDIVIFRPTYWPRFVEVRTNQFGMTKPNTVTLSRLPGDAIRQIWMFRNGDTTPLIRQWSEPLDMWVPQNSPWEVE